MPTKRAIESALIGIADLFKSRPLRVPVYQRAYSWRDEEVTDYSRDLKSALDDADPEYFLGTIVVTADDDETRYTVIDGQQRLATTQIFLSQIRDAFRSGGETARANSVQTYLSKLDMASASQQPTLVLSNQDDGFFRRLIIDEPAGTPKATTKSHKLIAGAQKQLKAFVASEVAESDKKWPTRLARWVTFLEQDVRVIRVAVPTESDAFVIFETLNDRGRDLTLADLVKNYLFGLAGARLAQVQDAWVATAGTLETTDERDVLVDFLRHYWSSKAGATRTAKLFKSIRETIGTEQGSVDFTEELRAASRLYAALLNGSHEYWKGLGTGTKARVETLLRLRLEQNRPLLLAAMQFFGASEMKRLLRALVAWSVRGLIVGGIGGGQTERYYADAAVDVRAGKIKTTADLEKFLAPIIPGDDVFKSAFETAEVANAKFSRYYLQALERAKQTEPEMVANEDEADVNLEHVLPQGAVPSEWPTFKADEISQYVDRLGNQVLLKQSQNRGIGNKPYAVKLPILKKSVLKLTKAAAKKDWSPERIRVRQEMLAGLAVSVWPRKTLKS